MDSKQQIFKTAESLFFRYGIKSISMDDVSRELGISKKTLYQYVANKKELIDRVMQQTLAEELNAMEVIRRDSTDAIDEMLRVAKHVMGKMRQIHPGAMFDLQKYYRESWKLMEEFNQQFIYNMIKENIEKGQKEELYRLDLNPDIIAKLYVGKTLITVDENIFPLREYNREELFREYIFYHIKGIASLKGLKQLEKYHE